MPLPEALIGTSTLTPTLTPAGVSTGTGDELLQLVDATGAMVRVDGVWYGSDKRPRCPRWKMPWRC